MTTTKIKIKAYLREFLVHEYGEEPVRFPDNSDILAFIHELRIRQPKQAPPPAGNLEIVIPFQKHGKDPREHNYLTRRSQLVIQNKVYTLFSAVLNDYVARKVHLLGLEYRDAIGMFMEEYEIDSITYDALKQKNYRDRNGKRFRRENRFREKKTGKNFPDQTPIKV
jgi:hypothetical protein